MTQTFEQVLQGRRIPFGWLLPVRSHFVDRYRPDCERIFLPERVEEDGVLRWRSGRLRAEGKKGGRRGRTRGRAVRTAHDRGWLADLRSYNSDNWAHFHNHHLPWFFRVARQEDRDPDRALLLLPAATPGYILAMVDLLDLIAAYSDDDFEGDGIAFDGKPHAALRRMRVQWARETGLLDRFPCPGDRTELPSKVFLSRRNIRAVATAVEVEDCLGERGFVTVYPEMLPVPAQFRLFRKAGDMVAVHGAGLAPLMLCEPGRGPSRLVEILPVGHMTDVYRDMAHAVGTVWIGVRGRLKPDHVAPAYDLETPFTSHSLESFEVDRASIELAFNLLGDAP